MKYQLLFIIVVVYVSSLSAQPYQWPVNDPVPPNNHGLNSNFGDYRPTTANFHFHKGVDVQENAGSEVYSIWKNENGALYQIIAIGNTPTIDQGLLERDWILIDHVGGSWSSRYVHLTPTPNQGGVHENLDPQETWNNDVSFADAGQLYQNHLHFELITDRHGNTNSIDDDVINPLLNPSANFGINWNNLDDRDPIIDNIYVIQRFDVSVSSWNYPNDFSDLMANTTNPDYIEFDMSAVDNPHFLVDTRNSGAPSLRFVLQARDNFRTSTDRGTPWSIRAWVDNEVFYDIEFDEFEGGNNNIITNNEAYQPERVFHTQPPLVSHGMFNNERQYYKLYRDNPFDPVPNADVVNYDLNLNDYDGLEEGQHILEVEVFGENSSQVVSKKVEFYVLKNSDGWVDFSQPGPVSQKQKIIKNNLPIAQRKEKSGQKEFTLNR